MGLRRLSILLILALWLAPAQAQTPGFSAEDVAVAQEFGAGLDVAEWLGPLAPVALSPFFGITCLSGLALFGSEWFDVENPLLGESSPLANQTLFAVFLILTILTSLPRLTKVSKPLAQGLDQVETWSVIITLAVLRLTMGGAEEPEAVAVVQLGVLSLPLDVLMSLAAALNVFAINSVKFFFEVLVWLTPLPFLDAAFEAANKSAVAALMAVYAWSPVAATAINLVLLGASLLVFRWMHRRQVYFRIVLFDLVRRLCSKRAGAVPAKITTFPRQAFGPFEDRARCRFQRTQAGWRLSQKRLFSERLVRELPRDQHELEIDRGLFTHALVIHELGRGGRRRPDPLVCNFSRRHDAVLGELAQALGAALEERGGETSGAEVRRAEFA